VMLPCGRFGTWQWSGASHLHAGGLQFVQRRVAECMVS
jgi:hypothetical protein